MRRLMLGSFVAITLLWSASSGAQNKPSLQIVSEDPQGDAAQCGIDKSGIESIAALTLRNNGIQAVTDFNKAHLYLNTTTLTTASGACAVNYDVAVRTYLPMPPSGIDGFMPRKGRTFAKVELCRRGGLLIVPRVVAAENTYQKLENVIKLCLGELEY